MFPVGINETANSTLAKNLLKYLLHFLLTSRLNATFKNNVSDFLVLLKEAQKLNIWMSVVWAISKSNVSSFTHDLS